jgi:hypothetical protein
MGGVFRCIHVPRALSAIGNLSEVLVEENSFHISWIQIQVFQCMKVVRPAHLLILSTLKNLPALCQILGNIMFSYFLLGGCGVHLHVSLDLAWTQFLDGCS